MKEESLKLYNASWCVLQRQEIKPILWLCCVIGHIRCWSFYRPQLANTAFLILAIWPRHNLYGVDGQDLMPDVSIVVRTEQYEWQQFQDDPS